MECFVTLGSSAISFSALIDDPSCRVQLHSGLAANSPVVKTGALLEFSLSRTELLPVRKDRNSSRMSFNPYGQQKGQVVPRPLAARQRLRLYLVPGLRPMKFVERTCCPVGSRANGKRRNAMWEHLFVMIPPDACGSTGFSRPALRAARARVGTVGGIRRTEKEGMAPPPPPPPSDSPGRENGGLLSRLSASPLRRNPWQSVYPGFPGGQAQDRRLCQSSRRLGSRHA
jgi:hypothetical protein